MLGLLRRKRNSPIIAFLLGAIIIVFVAFFGNTWQSCGSGGLYAAKVNGTVISDQDYSATYSSEFRNRQSRDAKFDRSKAQKENLRETVLNRMITWKILAQKARDRGLAVDDEALREEIIGNEAFQTDGKFDPKIYQARLNMQQLSDFRFEQQYREELLAQKLAGVAESSITVSTEEAREHFMKERRRVNLEFISIKKQPYEAKVGTVTPADAEEWLKTPDAEEQVKKYYTKHARTKYNVPRQVCARHILVRAEKGMPPDLYKEAQNKISQARKAVVGDKMDFAAAAKKFSDDSTKDKGGDLGCFGPGQMVPEFEAAAFGLKQGEVSGVVESPFGFHIIEVTGEKAAIERKLEDVKQEIALEILAGVKAGELAKARAEEIHAKAKTADSLAGALTAAGNDPVPLKVEETGPFPQREFVPRIGLSADISAAAWKLTKENPLPEKPFETDNAWVVIRLKERVEPTDEEFEKEKAMTVLQLSYQKRNNVIKAWTEQLRKNAEIDVHPLALTYDDDLRAQARGRQQ